MGRYEGRRTGWTDTRLVAWSWASLILTPVVWILVFVVGDVVTMDGTRLERRPWVWLLEGTASLVVVAPLVLALTLSVMAWRVQHRILTLVPAVIVIGIPIRELTLTTHDVVPLLVYAVALQTVVAVVLVLHGRAVRRREAASAVPPPTVRTGRDLASR